ncbi:hypothetical protein MYX75_03675 [Acidobacteria bacterium AH-259-A15]|nr:hypothetical protein [Acidobacteria bacterium AH-259-A15]
MQEVRFFVLFVALLGLPCRPGHAQEPSHSSTLVADDTESGSTRLLVESPDITALHHQGHLRRPVSLVLSDGGRRLFVANRRSGSISVIETDALEVRAEIKIGKTLADLAHIPRAGAGEERLLVVDEEAHELLVLALSGPNSSNIEVLHRLAVSRYPVSVTVSDDGARCFVASLWSKRLDLIDLRDSSQPRSIGSLELPFAPREQVVIPSRSRLVVADSFGGHLAIVDLSRGEIERVLDLRAHNIRGLAVTAEGSHLLVAQQSIDPSARTNRDDILWGVLMSNTLVSLRLEDVLSPTKNILHGIRTLDLGDLSAPSGDPQKVIVGASGEVMVALGGVGRVAIGRYTWPRLDHVAVARRPTDLASSPDGRLFVANALSDSISVIDTRARKPLTEISLGPQAALAEADEGELLFYDATLSLRGWMSCHSCHSDGHTNGTVADTLGDGDYGAPKRVPSLLGVGESGPWAWNGSMPALGDQIRKSLHTTLHARGVSEEQVGALETFLRTLEPPELPPIGDKASIRKGEEIFRRYRCHLCHVPPAYTSKGARDIGLSDEAGNRRFNPPSLRGVRYRPSFFHDGRARDLRDVFYVYQHPGQEIPPSEITDLIAFLSTL